jgi:hypothetical protein
VPELRLDLPPTAIGKDCLPGGAPSPDSPRAAPACRSRSWLAGVLVGWEEGLGQTC